MFPADNHLSRFVGGMFVRKTTKGDCCKGTIVSLRVSDNGDLLQISTKDSKRLYPTKAGESPWWRRNGPSRHLVHLHRVKAFVGDDGSLTFSGEGESSGVEIGLHTAEGARRLQVSQAGAAA